VKVNIVFGQDVDLAIDTLKEIGAALREDDKFKDGILSDFSFWGVDALDGSAITLTGQIQCRDSARWGVQREFNRRILDQFRERGIEIANPQRNLLTWDPESAPAKIEADDIHKDALKGAPKDEPPAAAPSSAAARQTDAPVEDQLPVDPKPAGGPGTPANPGSTSPHE
jgi:hypothetical protein